MSTINQYEPSKAIGIVVAAAFSLGAAQIITVLVIQFGAADAHIGIATGYVLNFAENRYPARNF